MECAVGSEGLRLTSQGRDVGRGGLKPLEERLVSGPGGEIKPTRLTHLHLPLERRKMDFGTATVRAAPVCRQGGSACWLPGTWLTEAESIISSACPGHPQCRHVRHMLASLCTPPGSVPCVAAPRRLLGAGEGVVRSC